MAEYNVSINGDPIDASLTRRAVDAEHAARLAATEGQNGEIITVISDAVSARFRIINLHCGKVEKVQ